MLSVRLVFALEREDPGSLELDRICCDLGNTREIVGNDLRGEIVLDDSLDEVLIVRRLLAELLDERLYEQPLARHAGFVRRLLCRLTRAHEVERLLVGQFDLLALGGLLPAALIIAVFIFFAPPVLADVSLQLLQLLVLKRIRLYQF